MLVLWRGMLESGVGWDELISGIAPEIAGIVASRLGMSSPSR
jgi:hypothetical protein